MDTGTDHVYQIDCQNYFSKSEICNGIEAQLGVSFEQLLDTLASESACTLIFEDAPIFEGKDKSARVLQQEIETLISIALDFCDNARIVVISRLPPTSGAIKSVELKPLDELDTKTYVSNHEKGGADLATAQFISRLHRHTDGIPSRIDMVLRDIQIVGAAQLHSLNADVAGKHAATETAPSGLASTLDEIKNSSNPNISRAFKLLKALAMFPRGEQLETVKRFNQTNLFYPQDASYLKDFALIDFVEIPSISSTNSESARAIVVRRAVREYLYATLSTSELDSLGRRALEIYFGTNWDTRGIKLPKGIKFNDRDCRAWKIGNASLLILRAIRDSVEHYTAQKCQSSISLTTSFAKKLYEGNHFRAVISLCDDILPLVKLLDTPPNTSQLTLELAESLRMTGEYEKSITLCSGLITLSCDKNFLQRIYLCLTKSYEALKKSDLVIEAANECIKIDNRNHRALSARSVLVRIGSKTPSKFEKLAQLEKQARRKKLFITANNIKLSMADRCNDPEQRESLILQVSKHANLEGDLYNAMRANISLAEIYIEESRNIERNHLLKLIEIYHYLYGEGLNSLFNTCHKVLWHAFTTNNDSANLLRLFRCSSLRWRLSGAERLEIAHIKKLNSHLTTRTVTQPLESSRELIYLISRSNQTNKLLADKSS
ncbi:hypothetical protein LRS11_19710 [Pseudomonas sp. J452]|uniref:tetratricopeptide repeat protein n=1 Tax=Pseudomonas sp. J452 TaxID=2898441 RepID=UPI0021ADC04E|nr:hypothetical protein [Pseudomonas sp. J452]UUY08010.1 hypothetical protein LRS11_19710 [Pseudomonas sp. J452]